MARRGPVFTRTPSTRLTTTRDTLWRAEGIDAHGGLVRTADLTHYRLAADALQWYRSHGGSIDLSWLVRTVIISTSHKVKVIPRRKRKRRSDLGTTRVRVRPAPEPITFLQVQDDTPL